MFSSVWSRAVSQWFEVLTLKCSSLNYDLWPLLLHFWEALSLSVFISLAHRDLFYVQCFYWSVILCAVCNGHNFLMALPVSHLRSRSNFMNSLLRLQKIRLDQILGSLPSRDGTALPSSCQVCFPRISSCLRSEKLLIVSCLISVWFLKKHTLLVRRYELVVRLFSPYLSKEPSQVLVRVVEKVLIFLTWVKVSIQRGRNTLLQVTLWDSKCTCVKVLASKYT